MRQIVCVLAHILLGVDGHPWTKETDRWNLNRNETAESVTSYHGIWENHEYFASPPNWRLPAYSLLPDRWFDGDPASNNAGNTHYEYDPSQTVFRSGGDIAGIIAKLDYLQSMGTKIIHCVGSPLQNVPWVYDGFSVTDFTLLDRHLGSIETWRELVTQVHARGMYILVDITLTTLADYLYFEGHMNETAPLNLDGYDLRYKHVNGPDAEYADFQISNLKYSGNCSHPRTWDGLGNLEDHPDFTCYDDDFVHYGDTEALSEHRSWAIMLSKAGAGQDRLAEWRPATSEKLNVFSCLMVLMLDIDGVRVNKASQIAPDFLATWASHLRSCAKTSANKSNLLVTGESASGNLHSSVYIGRGRSKSDALNGSVDSVRDFYSGTYIRESSHQALDGISGHYTIYRHLLWLLGVSGSNLQSQGENVTTTSQDVYQAILHSNDLVNANTKKFDLRHFYFASSQDVFRWPAVDDGVARGAFATILTHLLWPGSPTTYYGEEQDFYVLDSGAADYLYGRQPMTSSTAFQDRGCYGAGSSSLNLTLTAAQHGCSDDIVSRDHYDPSHPSRNLLKRLHEIRELYDAIRDGYHLELLGSYNLSVEMKDSVNYSSGLWSYKRELIRSATFNQTGSPLNTSVWILYANVPRETTYDIPCNGAKPLLTPFKPASVLKNLLYPYEEVTLSSTTEKLSCLQSITMPRWSVKAFVEAAQWKEPSPVITNFSPGHDYRLLMGDESTDVPISIGFSQEMRCDSVAISVESRTFSNQTARIEDVTCTTHLEPVLRNHSHSPTTQWQWSATLKDVHHGIHRLSLENYTSVAEVSRKWAGNEQFLLRVGSQDNPIVFPGTANYSSGLLQQSRSELVLNHKAMGADSFRYSLNFGYTWSSYIAINGPSSKLDLDLELMDNQKKSWKGYHVIAQYYSAFAGSSAHVQHSDTMLERHWPRFGITGTHNSFGYDRAFDSCMSYDGETFMWTGYVTAEWPLNASLTVWPLNKQQKPDPAAVYGDPAFTMRLIRQVPGLAADVNFLQFETKHLRPSYLGLKLFVDDKSLKWWFEPVGSAWVQVLWMCLLCITPLLAAIGICLSYASVFVAVRHNTIGVSQSTSKWTWLSTILANMKGYSKAETDNVEMEAIPNTETKLKLLIATIEYAIPPLDVSIKIGGLGVMANLMARELKHLDAIIWVVPMIGDAKYGDALTAGVAYEVKINNVDYTVLVWYYQLDNITYVVLDSPIFKNSTLKDPYPSRMDDLDSAIYYSAWNQCIALTQRRFQCDVYHVQDYHGACAPLYLLPDIIPITISLHNSEFQGLWPLRSYEEREEVVSVFNLSHEVMKEYIQYGTTFNLLHAAVTYIRKHQRGYGCVGVSNKYGDRSLARYPIFWSLKRVGRLPNPDPADTGLKIEHGVLTPESKLLRKSLKAEAQRWAGLEQDESAQLLVFVGRWSVQKGIDLIADLLPKLLKEFNVQLIAVGPTVDLYGALAAAKLEAIMQKNRTKVYSSPVFTKVPPAVFGGADFALIPSRDEPFGLVAVEFGKKGTLSVGTKVGGLGQMPGWWYTINSSTAGHLLPQFESALHAALTSSEEERDVLRAKCLEQSFPIKQWKNDLEYLYRNAIKLSHKARRESRQSTVEVAGPSADDLQQRLAELQDSDTPRISVTEPETFGKDLQSATPRTSVMHETESLPSIDESVCTTPWSGQTSPQRQRITSGHLSKPSMYSIYGSHRGSMLLSKESLALDSTIENMSIRNGAQAIFNDEDGLVKTEFTSKLADLTARNTTSSLCIETFITQREKRFFHNHKFTALANEARQLPWGMRLFRLKVMRLMQAELYGWPMYSILLAIGQVLGSQQMSLLVGDYSATGYQIYVLSSIYACSTIFWYVVSIKCPKYWSLSCPFAVYAISFLLLGSSYFLHHNAWISIVSAWIYAAASGSAGLFFSLNFGPEGVEPVETWLIRVLLVQGVQQVWSSVLWYWGNSLALPDQVASHLKVQQSTPFLLLIATWVFAGVLAICALGLFMGLPKYYRESPSQIPAFYRGAFRRRMIVWLLVAQVLSSFWVALPYARSWSFLWSSENVSTGTIVVLLSAGLIVWLAMILIIRAITPRHAWTSSIFAIGLIAPRWAQEFWVISRLSVYFPHLTPYNSALLGRVVWVWLGVLDALQGAGLGIMLLQTLVREYVLFALMAAQVVSACTVMLAKAVDVKYYAYYPNFAVWTPGDGVGPLAEPVFWVALLCQVAIPAGYIRIYRKSQLAF